MSTHQREHGDITEFGTTLLRTSVESHADSGYWWVRQPGPDAPDPFADHQLSVQGAIGAVMDTPSTAAVHLRRGAPEGAARRYRVGSSDSVASLLLGGPPETDVRAELHGLGCALRTLHDAPLEPEALGLPRALLRLSRWVEGRPCAEGAQAARNQLVEDLGAPVWAQVRGWCSEARQAPPVVTHGAPGLGSVVLPGPGHPAALLTGEDLSAGPWMFDLGWVVGELVELAWQLGWPTRRWQVMLDALFAGYGESLGEQWCRWATLRVLLHVHDFSAYSPRSAKALPAYSIFLTYLTTQEPGP